MDGSNGPDWLREAADAIRDEAVRFLVTVLQCTRHPRRFAAAWFAGETRAPNPIGYVSTALAITAATNSATVALVGINDDAGLWSSLASATLPYAYYALLGVLCHVVARTRATARPLSASLAIALFIGGGPGLLFTLSTYLDVLLYAALIGHAPPPEILAGAPPWIAPILLVPPMAMAGLFLLTLASAFRGLHGGSRARALAAILFALVASGLLFSALHAVVSFGFGVPHFVVHPGPPWFDIRG